MVVRNRRTRGGDGHGNRDKNPTRSLLGAVRRTQMITTYGVGSMVAIAERSYIVSGLDTWRVKDSDAIYEPRLQNWLGVERFQLPPADVPSSGDGVRTRLFPEMYYCPECHVLQEFYKFGSPPGKSVCGDCEKSLVPSRFVIACLNGHIDDFPYWQWVHKGAEPSDSGGGHRLRLHSTGRTASLRSVVIECSCGVPPVSLEGAFGKGAMAKLNIRCGGRRPWLGRRANQVGCREMPRTLQRGSSAAWFPVTRSALSIPPWSETLQQRVNPHIKTLVDLVNDGVSQSTIYKTIENLGILNNSRFTREEVLDTVLRTRDLGTSAPPEPAEATDFEPANRLRKEEYEKLYGGTANVDRGDDFECVPPEQDVTVALPYGIERSMLAKRLREVRVLESFTRVEMPDAMSGETRNAALSLQEVDWLPAIEVSGEGVFLAIDQKRLRRWENRPGPVRRAERIRENHLALLRRRARLSGKDEGTVRSPIRPRYLLLHTLAHILINEWSLDAGYPAASLRERLYVSDDMAGVLIYTATSDSAGSLGGVIAQGEHRRLRESLESALARATWCSQDPPCMESEASGIDSLNLAACYACVLLPETSCETNNVFLDRALLIGTPDDPSTGFFGSDREG